MSNAEQPPVVNAEWPEPAKTLSTTCTWEQDLDSFEDKVYRTDCGQIHYTQIQLHEQNKRFCMYCGKQIKVENI